MVPSVACRCCHHPHPLLVLHKCLSRGFLTVLSTQQQLKPGTYLFTSSQSYSHALSPDNCTVKKSVCLPADSVRYWVWPLGPPVFLASGWQAAQAHYTFLPICNLYPLWPGASNKFKFTRGRQEVETGVRISTFFGSKNIKPKQFIKF